MSFIGNSATLLVVILEGENKIALGKRRSLFIHLGINTEQRRGEIDKFSDNTVEKSPDNSEDNSIDLNIMINVFSELLERISQRFIRIG